MNAESAKKVGHPAPFPEELPNRLIQLYSFKDDVILDPFIGSGTTGIAALKCERRFVGYDISEEYVRLANNRINAFKNQTILSFHSQAEQQAKVTAPNNSSNDAHLIDKSKANPG